MHASKQAEVVRQAPGPQATPQHPHTDTSSKPACSQTHALPQKLDQSFWQLLWLELTDPDEDTASRA